MDKKEKDETLKLTLILIFRFKNRIIKFNLRDKVKGLYFFML